MKIFLDTADAEAIRRAADTGLLDGVTTNPSKIAETGKRFTEVLEDICSFFKGPVSAEAVAYEADKIIAKSKEITSIAPNINIKVPPTPEGLKAAIQLERDHNIRVNVTMLFGADQALMAMKTNAYIVSIVLSRLEKIGTNWIDLVKDTVAAKERYGFKSMVLGGSLKTRGHVIESLKAGADIVTIPEDLFFLMFKHPLTDQGLAEFDEAWKKVKE
jgi:transaldolase